MFTPEEIPPLKEAIDGLVVLWKASGATRFLAAREMRSITHVRVSMWVSLELVDSVFFFRILWLLTA